MPLLKNSLLHMWDKASQYLKKIGGTILVAVVLIWALEYFPRSEKSTSVSSTPTTVNAPMRQVSQMEQSYLGRIGHFIEPVISPLGFDWRMGVSLIAGIPAKEIVIGTMAVLYGAENDQHKNEPLQTRLQNQRYEIGPKAGEPVFNQAVALAFLVFVLLYFPCIAVIASIKRESGSWKYALLTVLYTTAAAWIGAFLTYRIALFFI
jgi:ferrous iron transport protein B